MVEKDQDGERLYTIKMRERLFNSIHKITALEAGFRIALSSGDDLPRRCQWVGLDQGR
jgi:hypothetical protein